MAYKFNPFTGNLDAVSIEDLSGYQPLDPQLTSLAGIVPGAEGAYIRSDGLGGWERSTASDLRADINFDTEVSNNTSVASNTTHRTSDGSDHSFIDQDVTAAGTPSFTDLTVTNDLTSQSITDNGQVQITPTAISGQSPYSTINAGATTNECTNPKFEDDLSDWTTIGGTVTRDTGEAWIGSASCKISSSVANAGIRHTITPTPSTHYIVSVRIKGDVGGEGVKLTIDTDTQGPTSTYFGNSTYSSHDNAVNDWRTLKLNYTVAANATSMTVDIQSIDATSQAFYVDAVQIEQKTNGEIDATPSPYCDGDMGVGHAWTGTANASTSTREAGFYHLAPVDDDSEGQWVQRKDGSIEGPLIFRADTMTSGGYIDETFPFEFRGDMQDNVAGTGVRHGVMRVKNDGEGPALYVQSDTTRRYAMVIDGGSVTSGSVLAVFAPADLATMKSSGGKFFEFADKDGNSPFQWAPGYTEAGVATQSLIDRYTFHGSGGFDSTYNNSDTGTLTGTVAYTSGSKNVTGTGTTFLDDFKVGDYFGYSHTGSAYTSKKVETITSDTAMTVTANFVGSHTGSGKNYQKRDEIHSPALFQLEGSKGSHPDGRADYFYNIWANGTTGQLHVKQSTSTGDKSIVAEGDGDALITRKEATRNSKGPSATATETDIFNTYTIPAHQLTDAKVLRVKFFGDMTALDAGTTSVIFRVKIGGTTVSSSNVTIVGSTNLTDFSGEVNIINSNGALKTHQSISAKDTSTSGGPTFAIEEHSYSSSVDMRLDNDLEITAQFNDASTMSVKFAYVELI